MIVRSLQEAVSLWNSLREWPESGEWWWWTLVYKQISKDVLEQVRDILERAQPWDNNLISVVDEAINRHIQDESADLSFWLKKAA